ncbi:hypothetical protein HKD37_14G039902 [Glycine soja]
MLKNFVVSGRTPNLNICGDIIDDGLMWMLRVIKKNFKPARHLDATNADDHDEGHNFINIEEEEQEIDQAEIDETSDCDWQRRKNTDLTALREKERKIKLSLCPTMKD